MAIAGRKISGGILSYFPRQIKPRDIQAAALREIEDAWDTSEVLVCNLPVSSGKSAIAVTVASWARRAAIITPNKMLTDQYLADYPRLHRLKAKADYWCSTFDTSVEDRPKGVKKTGGVKLCKEEWGCAGCNTYKRDLRKAHVVPHLLANYYIYFAHKLYRDTLIVDEAHQLVNMIKEMKSTKLWQSFYRFPDSLRTRQDIREWVNALDERRMNESLLELREELNSYRPRKLVEVLWEGKGRSGEAQKCIRILPLDIRDEAAMIWPRQVRRIVLLSATLSRKDVEQLGLSQRRIRFIEADSPITAERRPVFFNRYRGSIDMSYAQQDANIPKMQELICNLARDRTDQRGLIHVTYSLAEKLRRMEWPGDVAPRLLWHTRENKSEIYQSFRNPTDESAGAKILVASGMYEGIDLPYDACRWQVVAKVPWPSLGDPAIKYMLTQDTEYYAWETIKVLLQACGRVSRTLDDYGETHILDSTFGRLFRQNTEFFPRWFRAGLFIDGKAQS